MTTYTTILEPETIETETYILSTPEQEVIEQAPLTSKRPLPAAPFPKKYVHSVFANLQDARSAEQALRAAGFAEGNVYVLESHDFVEAMSQGQSPFGFLTSMDYDVYLREAGRGHAFVAVRPTSYNQLMTIRNLLAPHGARLAKYIDTWTVSELLGLLWTNQARSELAEDKRQNDAGWLGCEKSRSDE